MVTTISFLDLKKKTVFKHKDDKNIFSAGNMIQG